MKLVIKKWNKSHAWYDSPIEEYVSTHCGAKDATDAKRCEGHEAGGSICKHRDFFSDDCNRYSPYRDPKEGPKYKLKKVR